MARDRLPEYERLVRHLRPREEPLEELDGEVGLDRLIDKMLKGLFVMKHRIGSGLKGPLLKMREIEVKKEGR